MVKSGAMDVGEYSKIHQPVLLNETIAALQPHDGDSYLDLTAGAGSHAWAVMKSARNVNLTLVDRDPSAIALLKGRFDGHGARLIHSDMRSAISDLHEEDISFDMVLADLGFSSLQLEAEGRGFSYSRPDEPLDMRMDQSQDLRASDILNSYSLAELSRVLENGGLPGPGKLAKSIVQARPINSVGDFVQVLSKSFRGPRESRNRFLAVCFQAVRIEVNHELDQLQYLLDSADDLLKPGGRIAIISFHSIEDTMVKNRFAEWTKDKHFGKWILPIRPIKGKEFDDNPRARSSVLRAAAKKQK